MCHAFGMTHTGSMKFSYILAIGMHGHDDGGVVVLFGQADGFDDAGFGGGADFDGPLDVPMTAITSERYFTLKIICCSGPSTLALSSLLLLPRSSAVASIVMEPVSLLSISPRLILMRDIELIASEKGSQLDTRRELFCRKSRLAWSGILLASG